ncbi:cytochrome c oxidase assembly protein COX20, mitochondrial [Macrosteles quadrilineatus]|uniref:cytochrome c oxidase assembly protein COX20, mitochondrial n=1 Tax=Macrosteles quadrilineatus TaxID=74068 RepID=UPI0023E0E73D|nr:cytochrome c oxidase assembly protein COX20, mitochondrial [Macrosteles quadrilineatus]
MDKENDETDNRIMLFGRDVSTIPCFRNSWLYGISSGIGSGLLYFLFTSKPKVATHFGFTSTMIVTGAYWVICRYQYEKQVEELKKIKDYVEKRVLIEGTEMEKLYESEAAKDIEIANVSNIMK